MPSLLDFLLRRDRRRFFAVADAIKQHVPGVQDINIATPAASTRRLDLVLDGGFTIPADQSSAGVRLILFFIALAYHPSPPKIILLEEPGEWHSSQTAGRCDGTLERNHTRRARG